MAVTLNEANIIEITQEEARRIIDEFTSTLIGEKRSWGGLFLYRSNDRKHPKRIIWIAIDDSDRNCYIKEFKKREGAIAWLNNHAGPKTYRM